MELLFERFLSESRGEWSDIDLDLPSGDKREQAIQYIYQRYGELGAAMTVNVITYRGKSAAHEVGKALGFDPDALQRLSGLVANYEWKGPNDTMARSFQHAGFDIKHPRIAKYLELCLRVQDLPRHLGQHSGGKVICQGQLNKVVPLERASMVGRTVVQWDKEDCADRGMIKVDFLGLGEMAVITDCQKLVPQYYGVPLDMGPVARRHRGVSHDSEGRYDQHVPDREPRTDRLVGADFPGMLLPPRHPGSHHSSRSHCWQDDAPVYTSPSRT